MKLGAVDIETTWPIVPLPWIVVFRFGALASALNLKLAEREAPSQLQTAMSQKASMSMASVCVCVCVYCKLQIAVPKEKRKQNPANLDASPKLHSSNVIR
jgi:hypothetical protein